VRGGEVDGRGDGGEAGTSEQVEGVRDGGRGC